MAGLFFSSWLRTYRHSTFRSRKNNLASRELSGFTGKTKAEPGESYFTVKYKEPPNIIVSEEALKNSNGRKFDRKGIQATRPGED